MAYSASSSSSSTTTTNNNNYTRSPFIEQRRRKLFGSNNEEINSEELIEWENSTIEGTDLLLSSQIENSLLLKKTPHHGFATKVILEKEHQKSVKKNDFLITETPKNSPEHFFEKNNSKVRTALFSDISPNLFYKNSSEITNNKEEKDEEEEEGINNKKLDHNNKITYLNRSNKFKIKLSNNNKRKKNNRRILGEINHGVKHNIRKPIIKQQQQQKTNNISLKNLKILTKNNSEINDYIQDMVQLTNKVNNGKISQIKSTTTTVNNKENNDDEISSNNNINNKVEKNYLEFSKSDFQEEEDDDLSPVNLSNILKALEHEDNNVENNNKEIISSILSPISQMCDVTSELALDSPIISINSPAANNSAKIPPSVIKALTFDNNLATTSHNNNNNNRKRLFSIFNNNEDQKPSPSPNQRGEKRGGSEILLKRNVKRMKHLPENQTILDAGQKRFGLTECNVCNYFYDMGDLDEEILHANYHNGTNILRFNGWKDEHLIQNFPRMNSKIIRILPGDSKIWLKRAQELIQFVNRQLVCYENDVLDLSQSQIYLYIKNSRIIGCAVASLPFKQGNNLAYKMLNTGMCSEEGFPIKCVILRLWVEKMQRKMGVCRALLDSVKATFLIGGNLLENSDLALTVPTDDGAAFAVKYFKTENYLIYT